MLTIYIINAKIYLYVEFLCQKIIINGDYKL